MRFISPTEQAIASRLKALKRTDAINEFPDAFFNRPPRRAAVLIPFLLQNSEWRLLFIRRAENEGDRHSGQVAFAGGKRDASDENLEMTALREAEEEIGLTPDQVNILGRLNHHHTISEFQVTPYVGVSPWPYTLLLDEVEVARAFTMPLSWLADKSNYRTEIRQHPDLKRPWPIIYYDRYDGELLWGATARMTLSLIEVLSGETS